MALSWILVYNQGRLCLFKTVNEGMQGCDVKRFAEYKNVKRQSTKW